MSRTILGLLALPALAAMAPPAIPGKIKLTYFNIEGAAEPARICFRMATPPINFEDERIDFAGWTEMKPKTPAGALPILQIDDKPAVCQSGGIFRFAARLSGHMPDDPFEALQVEEIIGLVEDMQKELQPSMTLGRYPEKLGHFDAAPGSDAVKAMQVKLPFNTDFLTPHVV